MREVSEGIQGEQDGGVPPSARVHAVAGYAAVTLEAGELAFTVVPELSMLGLGLVWGDDAVIAPHRPLEEYLLGGHTIGVPLLYPWANRLGADVFEVGDEQVDLRDSPLAGRDPAGLPMHGTMAARPGWSIEDLTVDDHSATLRAGYAFDRDPEQLAIFPFPHELSVSHSVAASAVTIAVTVRATGGVAVPISFGWHPYLTVPGAPREDWRLVLPEREHVLLDESNLPTGQTERQAPEAEPMVERTFDNAYLLVGDTVAERTLAIEAGGRRVAVRLGEGYEAAQVYAPPSPAVVSLEPMTAPVDALRSGQHRWVPAGEERTATFAIELTHI